MSESRSAMLAVGAGGLLGAPARYAVGRWVAEWWGTAFPWGTLLINLTGCFVLGLYLTLAAERVDGRSTARLFVATGFLGAYTTFSAFSYETVDLVRDGGPLDAVVYVAASVLLGLAATAAGVIVARVSGLRS